MYLSRDDPWFACFPGTCYPWWFFVWAGLSKPQPLANRSFIFYRKGMILKNNSFIVSPDPLVVQSGNVDGSQQEIEVNGELDMLHPTVDDVGKYAMEFKSPERTSSPVAAKILFVIGEEAVFFNGNEFIGKKLKYCCLCLEPEKLEGIQLKKPENIQKKKKKRQKI
jgi:hypothetical protein